MSFIEINYLWNLLWIIPFILILFFYLSNKRKQQLLLLFGKRFKKENNTNLSKQRRKLKNIFFLLGIFFLIFALARPYWGYKEFPNVQTGRDVLAVIDVSRSMLAKDIKPNRLKHAKQILKQLIKSTPKDRYGLLAFSGTAFLECPLTPDRTTIFKVLNEIDTKSIPVEGTNIENAIEESIKAFKAAESTYKTIILFTDGDEVQGNTENALSKLKDLDIPLYIVGVGDPEGKGLIRLNNENGEKLYLRDNEGKLVKSPLNESLLKKLARETNGDYIHTTSSDPKLALLKDKVKDLIPEKYRQKKMKKPEEQFQIPLSIALILLLVCFSIGERKTDSSRKKIFLLCTVFILFLSTFSLTTYGETKANKRSKLKASKITQKVDSSENINKNKEKAFFDYFNSGVKAQKKNKNKKALELYSKTVKSANSELIKSKTYQNMGVIYHKRARQKIYKKPKKSLKILDKTEPLYKESMRLTPNRAEVKKNQQLLLNDRKKAKKIIKKRKELKRRRRKAKNKTKDALKNQKKARKPENKNKKKQQHKAEQKTRKAQDAVNKYNKTAKQLSAKKDKNISRKASKYIKKAQNAQKNKKYRNAEKNLKKALKQFGGPKRKRNRKENKDNNRQKKKKQKKDNKNKKQQAKNKTKQALDKQQEANKNQGKKQKEKQKQARKKTKEAKRAANKSKKKSTSPKDKKKTKRAEKRLKNALNAQDKGKGKKAEKELKKALQNLKPEESSKNKKNNQRKKSPEKLPKANAKKDKQKEGKKKKEKIDKRQAEALLKSMTKKEKDLNKELKTREKMQIRTPDKKW